MTSAHQNIQLSSLIWLSVVLAVSQTYNSETHNEYIVLHNDALLKCNIPSFVADFVTVSGWVDSQGQSYHPKDGLGKGIYQLLQKLLILKIPPCV